MKADAGRLARVSADPAIRLVLLHGGDDSASRDHAARLARQFADAADPLGPTTLDGASLKADPSALAGAAAAVSMFGDRMLVRVDGATDEAEAAVRQLLDGPPGNLVIMVAGVLRKGSKLLTLAESHPAVLAVASWPPSPRDAIAMVVDSAAELGLKPTRGAAVALSDATAGDRGVLRRELEKLALFLDATPARPVALDEPALAAVGAGAGDADTARLVAGVVGGNPALAAAQLARLDAEGASGITLLRAVARRVALLADLAASGLPPAQAVATARPPIFPYADRDAVADQLARWRPAALATAAARLLAAERAIKAPHTPGDVLATQLLLALATQAARR